MKRTSPLLNLTAAATALLAAAVNPARAADHLPVAINGFLMNTREVKDAVFNSFISTDSSRECNSGCWATWPSQELDGDMIGRQNWRNQHRLSFTASTLGEEDSLCQAYGVGCLVVNYSETPGKFSFQIFGDASDNASYIREREIDLRGMMRDSLPKSMVKPVFRADYAQELSIDEAAFRQELGALGDDAASDAVTRHFIEFVAMHPRLFSELSTEFAKSYRRDIARGAISGRTQVLEQTLGTMLYLTVEAFSKIADSHSPAYPYVSDNLVTRGSLLDVDQLYTSLSKFHHWPTIVQFTKDMREQMEPIYRENEDGHYVAMGVYLPEQDKIAFDLTEPFFDVAYALFHELWHLRVYYSPRTQEIAQTVLALVNAPDAGGSASPSDDMIGHTLDRFFAEHELLAIDQSARLFRGTGQLAEQWGPVPAASAGWHESYLGGDKDINIFVPHDLRKVHGNYPDSNSFLARSSFGVFALPFQIAGAKHADTVTKNQIQEKESLALNYEAFLKSRTVTHLNHYRDRYLSDIQNFDFESLKTEYAERETPIVEPDKIHLTCGQVTRILTALGPHADSGIPFPFEVDGGWEKCGRQPVKFMCSLPYLRPERSKR